MVLIEKSVYIAALGFIENTKRCFGLAIEKNPDLVPIMFHPALMVKDLDVSGL